ncbi:hypothetical protein J2W14_002347 [Pseudarthrobacter oxydans]|nr:hypothetical protein [Pseudarthrobacter oxydans]
MIRTIFNALFIAAAAISEVYACMLARVQVIGVRPILSTSSSCCLGRLTPPRSYRPNRRRRAGAGRPIYVHLRKCRALPVACTHDEDEKMYAPFAMAEQVNPSRDGGCVTTAGAPGLSEEVPWLCCGRQGPRQRIKQGRGEGAHLSALAAKSCSQQPEF